MTNKILVIGDLILDPAPCTGENTYRLYLNFEYENVTNEFFDELVYENYAPSRDNNL